MRDVVGEAAFAVLARANELERQGRSIVHLEIGEPDFDTPEPIVEAAVRELRGGATHYSPSAGIPELRTAIAAELGRSSGADVRPDRVVVAPGAKLLLFSSILALIDPGDEVLIPDPAFPAYEAAIRIAGGTPVPVPLAESNEFRLNVADLEARITPRTRLAIINSPENPTGGVLTLGDLQAVADLAVENDFYVLSDEIYSEIYYDERPASMLQIPNIQDRLILVHGFSKTYAMTGWRLGFAVLPEQLVDVVVLMINSSVSCTSTFTQKAAMAAFSAETRSGVERMVGEFRRRRDAIVDGLNSIPGVHCLRPKGAFYVFPNVQELGATSEEIAVGLLEDAGVSALPGTAFGKNGAGYLRFSFANSLSNIEEAVKRIRNHVAALRAPKPGP